MLTSFAADNKVFPAIKAGAVGYLLKDSSPEELVQGIRQFFRGEGRLLADGDRGGSVVDTEGDQAVHAAVQARSGMTGR